MDEVQDQTVQDCSEITQQNQASHVIKVQKFDYNADNLRVGSFNKTMTDDYDLI